MGCVRQALPGSASCADSRRCIRYSRLRDQVINFFATLMYQVIEFYEQNLRLARKTGDQHGEMGALGSLGRAYAALGEHDKAVECYKQVLELARQFGDARSERQTLKHLNEVLKSQNGNSLEQTTPSRKSSKKACAATAKSASKKSSQRPSAQPRASRKKVRQLQTIGEPEQKEMPPAGDKKS